MQLPSDPNMLLSYVNLKLRDYYSDLEKLYEDLDVEQAEIEEKLAKAGYFYDGANNRFA